MNLSNNCAHPWRYPFRSVDDEGESVMRYAALDVLKTKSLSVRKGDNCITNKTATSCNKNL